MGVGNWRWSSRVFSTDSLSVNDLVESWEELRERAFKALIDYLKGNHPEIELPEDATLQWAEDELPSELLSEALDDEFPYWDSQESWGTEQSQERWRHFLHELVPRAVLSANKDVRTDPAEVRHYQCPHDTDATTVAVGRLVQVVMRHWETDFVFGIGPTAALDNEEPTFENEQYRPLFELIGRVWAACSDDPAFDRYRQPLVPVEVSAAERAEAAKYERINDSLLSRVLGRVVSEATLIGVRSDEAAAERFEKAYGISAETLVRESDVLDELCAFVRDFGGTPAMVGQAYDREFAVMFDAVVGALASEGETVCRPDTAWTSTRVDLSPYRQAVVMQLHRDGVKLALGDKYDDVLQMARETPAYKTSVMSESVYERSVAGAVKARYPHEVALFKSDGMWTLHLRDANDREEGVLVFRGHESWGHLPGLKREQDEYFKSGTGRLLSVLPSWFHLATDVGEIKDILSSLSAPQSLRGDLYGDEGEPQVTGLLVEVRDGEYGSVFASTSARPYESLALYECVLLNGRWNEPAPEATMEPGHG